MPLKNAGSNWNLTRRGFLMTGAAGSVRLFALQISPIAAAESASIPFVSKYSDHLDLLYYLDDHGQRQPVRTAADWERRRRAVLDGMQAVMGKLPHHATRSPLDVQVLEEVRIGKVVRRKLTYQSEPGSRVPAYVFIPPHDANKKLAAVLCLHQTNQSGKSEAAGLVGNPEMGYARELAERGFVTLAPDFPTLGEHDWDLDKHPKYVSGTMKSIWDNIRGVDLLQSLPEADGERIGCLGHSLGGHGTLFTGAFEPRLKAFVTSCGFSRFGRDDVPSWTGKRYMPLIKSVYASKAENLPFDFPEILGTLAPRPLLVIAAKKDHDFDVRGVEETLAIVRPLYKLLGQESRLQVRYPDVPHAFPQAERKAAYEFLDKHLRSPTK